VGCLGILFLWIICVLCMVFPPLGIVAVIVLLIYNSCGHDKSGTTMQKVHYSKISFPYCRPYSYEIDKDGMVWARSYRDKRGRLRYCCNPNHNHSY
jgi:hypothetical protein